MPWLGSAGAGPMTSPRTLLEALIQKLRGCNVSSDAELDSVAVLWTDPRSEWKSLIPLLRQQLPELMAASSAPHPGGRR